MVVLVMALAVFDSIQAAVKEVRPREIVLGDNSTLPYGMAIWAAGEWKDCDFQGNFSPHAVPNA